MGSCVDDNGHLVLYEEGPHAQHTQKSEYSDALMA